MRYEPVSDGVIKLTDYDSFDVGQTFECGQCFRFVKKGGRSYRLIARGRALDVRQRGDETFFSPCGTEEFEKIWIDYFDLKTDYMKIKERLSADGGAMREAVEFGGGIRILNQERWETLVSFIISQNKRIPQIKKIVNDLAVKYGDAIESGSGAEYSFPSARRMRDVTVGELLELKTGFRAKYIYDAIRKVNGGEIDLDSMDGLETEAIRERLTRVAGVGPKVANCALLFSFGRRESFPVDTWVKKATERFYFGGEPTPATVIQRFAEEKFGEYGGYAQQYMFYYMRETARTVFDNAPVP